MLPSLMPPTPQGDGLSSVYTSAAKRLEQAKTDASARASKAMASTSGWQAAAKAAAAQAVLEATIYECSAVIGELAGEHVRSGDADRAGIARSISERLIDALEPPGVGFLAGTGPEAAALASALTHHKAEFEWRREALKRDLPDRVRAARGEPSALSIPASRGSLRDNAVLFWFLVV